MDEADKGGILFGPEPGKESQKKYGNAAIQARKEYAEMGITHPTGKTPGFRERIQEIYKNLMGDLYKPVYSNSIKEKEPQKEDLSIPNNVYTVEEMRKTQQEAPKNILNAMLAKTFAKGEAWHKAMDQAQNEFLKKGIADLSYQNTDIIKRANEIYDCGTFADFEKESYPKHLRRIEKDKSEEEMSIKSLPGKTYGGYSFSLAQLETVSRLSEDVLVTIGKTMVKSLAARKRKYQIKQDLFMAIINWDAEFFVELAFADSFFLEKPLISAFYYEFEYENEVEAKKMINKSEYLKHYPELKNEILKDALWIASGRH